MWFPWSQTNPTKFGFAVRIFANHVITSTILFNRRLTFRAFLFSTEDRVTTLPQRNQSSPTLVLAAIQLEVSESSSHFLIHLRRRVQRTGSCQLLPQAKQNVCPQRQVTGRDSTCCTRITLLQSGLGHHLNNLLHCNGNQIANLYRSKPK